MSSKNGRASIGPRSSRLPDSKIRFWKSTRSTEGAGLGLPIVFLLCQAMGGGLRLASEPGQGLKAEVVLPAA